MPSIRCRSQVVAARMDHPMAWQLGRSGKFTARLSEISIKLQAHHIVHEELNAVSFMVFKKAKPQLCHLLLCSLNSAWFDLGLIPNVTTSFWQLPLFAWRVSCTDKLSVWSATALHMIARLVPGHVLRTLCHTA